MKNMAGLKELLRKLKRTSPDRLSPELLNLTISRAVMEQVVSPDEGRMLLRITALSRTPLWEVMVPLARICSAEASDTITRVIELCLQSGHSRLPVYEGHPGNIIGIIHAKELLRLWKKRPRNLRAVELIRLPTFLPKTIKLSQALAEFRRKKISIAVVIDEYGMPAGLVTSEDLIERIVGEMQDELAKDHEYMHQAEARTFMVDTSMPLDKFAEAFGLQTASKAHSVAGYLLEELQRIPQDGEVFKVGGLEITVIQSTPTGISRIRVNQKKG
jgi:magnesium and cobalt transporter